MSQPPEQTKGASPLVRRVARDLGRLISADRSRVGGRLPAERELAEQLQVSRATLRKALQLLAATGAITPAPQSGWYVSATPLSAPPQRLVSFTDLASRRGQSVMTRLLSAKARIPRFEEAEFFTAPTREPVLELNRLRILGDKPACLDRSVLPLWRMPSLAEVDWETASLYRELTNLDRIPSRSDFVVEAALAGEHSDPLQIAPGAPVAKIHERCYDQFGGPVLLGFAVYTADNYRFHATLTAKAKR